jgi:hypothetical protein
MICLDRRVVLHWKHKAKGLPSLLSVLLTSYLSTLHKYSDRKRRYMKETRNYSNRPKQPFIFKAVYLIFNGTAN